MKTKAEIEREMRFNLTTIELAQARINELGAQLEARAALPDEPEMDSVIKFRVQFDPHGIVYTFVAYRTRRHSSAQWYTTTGTNTKHKGPHSWDDLLDLMSQDVSVKTGASKLEFFLFSGEGEWVR